MHLDRGYVSLSFGDALGLAYDGYAGGKSLDLSKTETVAKLEEFATERLRGLLASATSPAVADAVLAGTGAAALGQMVATLSRARALQAVVDAKEPWLDKAKTVAKRLAGISREARPLLHEALGARRCCKKKDDLAIRESSRASSATSRRA